MKTRFPMSLLKDVLRYKDAVAMVDSTSKEPRFVMWGKVKGVRAFPLPNGDIARA